MAQAARQRMNPGLGDENNPGARLATLLAARAQRDGLWQPQTLRRGAILFEQGLADGRLVVLTAGLVKLSYLTGDGTERVKSFIADCGVFAGDDAMEPGQASRYSAICLETSTGAMLPAGWVREALRADGALAAALPPFLDWLRRRKERRAEALLCQSAEQRYGLFLAEEPALAARLSQADIARYLGVTPIAFSRIKKRRAAPVGTG